MAHQIPTSFTRYQFSEEEQMQAYMLTTLNLQNIQNLISAAAEEKLNMKFDPSNTLAFAQREAELQGQIGILKYLVELASVPIPSHVISTNSPQ